MLFITEGFQINFFKKLTRNPALYNLFKSYYSSEASEVAAVQQQQQEDREGSKLMLSSNKTSTSRLNSLFKLSIV